MIELSIIIPVLNEELTLPRLLTQLCSSPSRSKIEIIIVDGGSTDDTLLKCNSCEVTVIQSEAGRAKQMNEGARLAKGKLLYFVHADTVPPISYFEDILEAVSNKYEFGCYRFKFESKHLMLYINSYCTRFDRLWLRGGDQTLFVTRELFEQLNGFDESYTIMEEYDFIRRAKKVAPFRIMPKSVLVSARKYNNNSWVRVQLVNAKAVRMFMKGIHPDHIREFYKRNLNPY